MKKKLWKFVDNKGTFESDNASKVNTLYFPLANESFMSRYAGPARRRKDLPGRIPIYARFKS